VLIDRDEKGKMKVKEFVHEQKPKEVLEILGYYEK